MGERNGRATVVVQRKELIDSHLGLGRILLEKFYQEIHPRKIEAIEYPFAVSLSDPNTGEQLDVSLVGVMDLVESDGEGNPIFAELKTSSKRYGESQDENQLDGLIYAFIGTEFCNGNQ